MNNNKSKNKRLGSIPRGLEWIEEGVVAVQDDLPLEQEVVELDVTPLTLEAAAPKTSAAQEIDDVDDALFEHVPSAQRGLPKGWTRSTLIVREIHIKKLKALAYWDRVTIKHLLDQALNNFLDGKRVRSMNVKKM